MRITAWLLIVLQLVTCAWAGPESGVVAAGSATIDTSRPNTTAITQQSARAIVNWQGFSTAAHESVTFAQPSATAVVLNRVTGGAYSQLDGTLTANGRVFVLNQNGVVFGKTARVNVGGLVASSLEMTDADFMAGRHNLTRPASGKLAAVVNQGVIRTAEGGAVALVGPVVSNQGTIEAPIGRVALAAGTKAVVNLDGAQLVNLALPDSAAGDVSIPSGAVSDALKSAVNDDQIVEGGTIREENGRIFLGKADGLAINEGVIHVSGRPGQISVDSTRASVAAPTSRLSARGTGSGGDARILSRGTSVTAPASLIDVSAGSTGDGGFAEVSGDRHVKPHGSVSALAPAGKLGTYLIDPSTLTILNGPANACDPVDVMREGTIENAAFDVSLNADSILFRNLTTDGILSLPNGVSMFVTANGGNITFEDPNDIVFAPSSTSRLSFFLNGQGNATLPRLTAGRVDIFGGAPTGLGGSLTFTSIAALGPPDPQPPPPLPPPGAPAPPLPIALTASIFGFRSVRGGSIDAAAATVAVSASNDGTIDVGNVTAAGDIQLSSQTIAPPNLVNTRGRVTSGDLRAGRSIFVTGLAGITMGNLTAGGDVNLFAVAPPPIAQEPVSGPIRTGNVDANGSVFANGSTITMGNVLSRRPSPNFSAFDSPAFLQAIGLVSNGRNFRLIPGPGGGPGFQFALPDPGVALTVGNVRALQGSVFLNTPGRLTFDTLVADSALFVNAIGQSGVKGNSVQTGVVQFPTPFTPGIFLNGLDLDVPLVAAASANSFVTLNSQLFTPAPFAPPVTGRVLLGQAFGGTVSTFGEIVDTNGSAINIVAQRVFLGGTTVGRIDDPIEIAGGATLNGFASGSLAVDATGDVTIGEISTPRTQIRAAGSILASTLEAFEGEQLSNIDTRCGTGDVVLAAGGVIGTLANPLTVNIAPGTLAVSATGQQGGVSVAIKGVVSPSNSLIRLNTPPGQVRFNSQQVTTSGAFDAARVILSLGPSDRGSVNSLGPIGARDGVRVVLYTGNDPQVVLSGDESFIPTGGVVEQIIDLLFDETFSENLFALDGSDTLTSLTINVYGTGSTAHPRISETHTNQAGEGPKVATVDLKEADAISWQAAVGSEAAAFLVAHELGHAQDPGLYEPYDLGYGAGGHTIGDQIGKGGAWHEGWADYQAVRTSDRRAEVFMDGAFHEDRGGLSLGQWFSKKLGNDLDTLSDYRTEAAVATMLLAIERGYGGIKGVGRDAMETAFAEGAQSMAEFVSILKSQNESATNRIELLISNMHTVFTGHGSPFPVTLPARAAAPSMPSLPALPVPPPAPFAILSTTGKLALVTHPVSLKSSDGSRLDMPRGTGLRVLSDPPRMVDGQTSYRVEGIVDGKPVQGWAPASGLLLGRAASAPAKPAVAPASSTPVASTPAVSTPVASTPATVPAATVAATTAVAAPVKLTQGSVLKLSSGVTVLKSNSPTGKPVVDVPAGTEVTIDSGLLLNAGQSWYAVKVYIPGSGTSYGYVPAGSLK